MKHLPMKHLPLKHLLMKHLLMKTSKRWADIFLLQHMQ